MDVQEDLSLVNFQIAKQGEISEEDRLMLVKIADIIEKGIAKLSQDQIIDYQDLLNFIMSINQEYRKYIIVKVSDKAPVPHISEIKNKMKMKQEMIKAKVG